MPVSGLLAYSATDVETALHNLFEGNPTGEERAVLRHASALQFGRVAAEYLTKVGDEQFKDIDPAPPTVYETPIKGDPLLRILAGVHRHFGGNVFFRRFGVGVEAFYVTDIGGGTVELEARNLQAKSEFNAAMDREIEQAHLFWQETTDYDILGQAKTLSDSATYRQSGARRLAAFEHAVNANRADVRVCMRVYEQNSDPYAVDCARELLKSKVAVYSHDGGRKFAAALKSRAVPGWQNLVKNSGWDARRLERETSLPQQRITGLLDGPDSPTIHEMEQIGHATELPLLIRTPVAVTIYRDFETAGIIPGEPQVHRFFYGMIFTGWSGLFNYITDYIGHHATDENEVMLEGDKVILKKSRKPTF